MSDLQRDESTSAPAVKRLRREIRYDAVAAVIAAMVGMLALGVAAYTAYIQRQQVSAQVWPYLLWANSDNQMDFMWMNKAALGFYETVRRDGTQKAYVPQMQTREELYDFLGYHAYEDKLDELFAAKK